jgi:20S proteasome alpha/beta subunit
MSYRALSLSSYLSRFILTVLILIAVRYDANARPMRRVIEVKDTSLMYSDDGEILQVSYAKKAIDKAASVVGITDGRIGASLCRIPVRSRLHIRNPKITFNILQPAGASNRLLLCFTGLAGDVRHLLLDANTVVVSHRVSFGETVSPKEMSTQISRLLTLALHPR